MLALDMLRRLLAERDVQRIAMEGWTAARALAPKGGAVDLLGPVNTRLRELDAMPNMSARYAEVAIRAAVSAAQEERDEMGLFLDHARDLSKQMALAGAPAQWPLPIDELEGELWFEVDRFTEARDAYERATKTQPARRMRWIGLARAQRSPRRHAARAPPIRRARATPGLPTTAELEMSLYVLKCQA